jgi:V-type H+-transporting ATPase subunit C
VDDYLLNHWHWNEGRYGTQRALRDMTDILVKARVPNIFVSPDAIQPMITGDDIDRQHHEGQTEQLQPCQGLSCSVAAQEDVTPIAPINTNSCIANKRICRGNLSVRSLADIVSEDDILQDSEYMQSILVAVPRYRHCSRVTTDQTNGDSTETS